MLEGGMVMHNPYQSQMREETMKKKMTVTGTGSLLIEPNHMQVQLEVMTENKDLRKAQQENTLQMNKVIETLINLGIPRNNIQTTAYRIQPTYDYSDGKQILRGYEVINAITVKVTQIDQAGNIIDLAVGAGVNRISNIRFTVDNPEIYYDQALKFALEDALRKAQTMAEEMQLYLNPTPICIKENFSEASAKGTQTLATISESYTTPIEPGQLNIKAVVTVQFDYQ